MDQNRLTLFERFRSMDLPAHELHTFNHLLQSDRIFRNEYENFELITKCIHKVGELGLRNEIMDWHKYAYQNSAQKNQFSKYLLYVVIFCGMFSLSFFLFYQTDYLKNERNFNELFGLYPIHLSAQNPNFRAIQSAFDQGNMEATIHALNSTPVNILPTHSRSFYRGVCSLALTEPQTQQAIDDFHEVLAVYGPHSDDAHWYLALAYLYESNQSSARSHLEAISLDYHPEAVRRFYAILDN